MGNQLSFQAVPAVRICAQVWTHLLRNILTAFEVMVSVRQDLRFHNRYNAVLQVRVE